MGFGGRGKPSDRDVLWAMEQRWIDHAQIHRDLNARMDRDSDANAAALQGIHDDLKQIGEQIARFQGVLWMVAILGPIVGGGVISAVIKLVH